MAAGGVRWTRRAMLSLLALLGGRAGAQRGRTFASGKRVAPDPATEFPIARLTDPAFACGLPGGQNRAVARRESFIIVWSDRTGSRQAFQLDYKNGQSRQLTEAERLDAATLWLLPNEKSICYFDGRRLVHLELSKRREREIYESPEGWERQPGLCLAPDGKHAALFEVRNGVSALRIVRIPKGGVETVLEAPGALHSPLWQNLIAYRRGQDELWVVEPEGGRNRRLSLAPGAVGPFFWSQDGRRIVYLSASTIRECDVETGGDTMVAKTSQYAAFAPNSDGSVFVGASGSRASPYVLLLLRLTRRELALCEHRSSDPGAVSPIFSPDSQRVYFQSDREGKPAIYMATVERLVEAT
jgi:oligogalacturonide lyase